MIKYRKNIAVLILFVIAMRGHSLELVEPEFVEQNCLFTLLAYSLGTTEGESILNSKIAQGWDIEPIGGEVDVKGANAVMALLQGIKDVMFTNYTAVKDWNLEEINLEEKERSGLIAVKKSIDTSNSNNKSKTTVVIAFKGTDSVAGALTDINFEHSDLPFGLKGTGHSGFVSAATSSYSEVKAQLLNRLCDEKGATYKNLKNIVGDKNIPVDIVVMGHSLGAAKALLTAKYLVNELGIPSASYKNIRVSVITMGGPRVFDPVAAESMNQLFGPQIIRFTADTFDAVPNLPLECYNYKHVGKEVVIAKTDHLVNFEEIDAVRRAFFLDTSALFFLLRQSLSNVLEIKNRVTPVANTTFMDLGVSLINAGITWHGCNSYLVSIIKRKVYRHYYSKQLNLSVKTMETDNVVASLWNNPLMKLSGLVIIPLYFGSLGYKYVSGGSHAYTQSLLQNLYDHLWPVRGM